MWRLVLVVVACAGCRQIFGIGDPAQSTGDARLDGNGDGIAPDGACGWPYMPSNFDPCGLTSPTTLPAPMQNKITIDSNTTLISSMVVLQMDGSPIRVIHLSSFTLQASDSVVTSGTIPIVFAVDAGIVIDGEILAEGGTANGCTDTDGMGATQGAGGGGAGGAGAEFGGDGGDGVGTAFGIHGAHGGKRVDPTLVPLVSGCPGRNGGPHSGNPIPGGLGGGAVQLSSKIAINYGGKLFATGEGGSGGSPKGGGGGGGAGGGILLEAPSVLINTGAVVCADGGSGGEGGAGGVPGASGTSSPCTANSPATTADSVTGGNGGAGGFAQSVAGAAGAVSPTDGGGGGGGGGIGWIHFRGTMSVVIEPTAIVTPDPH